MGGYIFVDEAASIDRGVTALLNNPGSPPWKTKQDVELEEIYALKKAISWREHQNKLGRDNIRRKMERCRLKLKALEESSRGALRRAGLAGPFITDTVGGQRVELFLLPTDAKLWLVEGVPVYHFDYHKVVPYSANNASYVSVTNEVGSHISYGVIKPVKNSIDKVQRSG